MEEEEKRAGRSGLRADEKSSMLISGSHGKAKRQDMRSVEADG